MIGIFVFLASVLTLVFIYATLATILNFEAGWGGLWDLGTAGGETMFKDREGWGLKDYCAALPLHRRPVRGCGWRGWLSGPPRASPYRTPFGFHTRRG